VLIYENHSKGSSWVITFRNGQHPHFDMIGLSDAFLDAGALPTLHDRYGISTEAVKEKIKSHLK